MSDDLTIRHDLRCGDLGRLIALHGEAYESLGAYGLRFEAFVAQTIADFMLRDDAKGRIWLAERGGQLVGCTAIVLRDNNSTNGTLCNGEKIAEKALTFGDSVQVADTVMTFSCDGWEYRDSEPDKAIASFEACLEKEPNFVLALQHLAFLLERNVARKKEAEPLWKRITDIDQGR